MKLTLHNMRYLALGSVLLATACTPDATLIGNAPNIPEQPVVPQSPSDPQEQPQQPSKPGTFAIQGSLVGLSPPPGSTIHLTFVWGAGVGEELGTGGDPNIGSACPQPAGYSSTTIRNHTLQSVMSVSGEFPLAFQLPISAMPPEAALQEFEDVTPSPGRYAVGYVMAFIDDGDGIFQSPEPGNAPDVLATSSRHNASLAYFYVVYIEGSSPQVGEHDLGGMPSGMSMVRNDQVLPIDTAVELELVEDADPFLGCAAIEYRREYGPAPATFDSVVCASDDGLAALWSNNPGAEVAPCVQQQFIGGLICLEENETPPSWWPCPR